MCDGLGCWGARVQKVHEDTAKAKAANLDSVYFSDITVTGTARMAASLAACWSHCGSYKTELGRRHRCPWLDRGHRRDSTQPSAWTDWQRERHTQQVINGHSLWLTEAGDVALDSNGPAQVIYALPSNKKNLQIFHAWHRQRSLSRLTVLSHLLSLAAAAVFFVTPCGGL